MANKKHKPEEIIGLARVEIVLAQDVSTAEACRRIAVSEQTFCRGARNTAGDG